MELPRRFGFDMAGIRLSLPSAWRLVQCTRAPRPASRPEGVSEAQWPLWFVAYGFDHTRRSGPLLLLGLLLSTVV